jgi:Xaa-Pro aminopeptidase
MTRVVALGEATAKQREIYEIVLKAQQTAIDHLKAGITCKDADQFARDVIVKAGWGENFGHGLGHGVGLEVHESPRLSPLSSDKDLLKQGMVVTVEPGIYIPGWGGVRIEDLVVIKEESCYVLTRSEKKLLVI